MPSRAMELRRSDVRMNPARYERCQDTDGNRYVVAVWSDTDGIARFTLLDGTSLVRVDNEGFLMPSGTRLRRCKDEPFAHWA